MKPSQSPPALALVLSAVIVALAASLLLARQPDKGVAHDAHYPDLFFELEGGGTLGSYCRAGQSPPWSECNAPVGESFPVTFYMQTTPDVAWEYVQFSIDFSGVTSKNNPQFLGHPDECSNPANVNLDIQPNAVIFGCTVSAQTASVVTAQIDFNCTDTLSSSNEIRMFVGVGDGDTYVVDGSGERHSEATQVESMFINCVEPERADMHLEVKGGDASCDDPSNPTACDVLVGDSFTLAIATDDPPEDGYHGFTTELLYGGLRYNPAPDDPDTFPDNEGAEIEVVWPDSIAGPGREPYFDITGKEGYVRHAAFDGQPDHAGNLVELSMSCQQDGSFPVTLTAYNYPKQVEGSLFYTFSGPDNIDTFAYLNSEDTVTIRCAAIVGGISLDPDLGALPLETAGSSGTDAGLLAGVIAAATVGIIALGGAAWYARRRWLG